MLQKGSMLKIKKIIGILLALYVFTYFYRIEFLSNILEINYLHVIVMAIASYFLIISGRQL